VEKRIIRLPVHPTSVIVAACMSVLALLMMLLMTPFIIAATRMASQFSSEEMPIPMGGMAGMGMSFLVFMPVLYFVMTYVTTAIMLLVFNFVAPKLGGVPVIVADEL
jgi:hypothetical protein